MTITGPEGMKFLEEKGATRVVPARELSLEELSAMHKASPLEIETLSMERFVTAILVNV